MQVTASNESSTDVKAMILSWNNHFLTTQRDILQKYW